MTPPVMGDPVRYCGREFTALEIQTIRDLIESAPQAHRALLSRIVCRTLNWRSPDGQRIKEMSCRVAMLRMHDDGLIQLPAAAPPQWQRPAIFAPDASGGTRNVACPIFCRRANGPQPGPGHWA